jgi:hypothetical protein
VRQLRHHPRFAEQIAGARRPVVPQVERLVRGELARRGGARVGENLDRDVALELRIARAVPEPMPPLPR